jgi:hypothetical protein
MSKFKLTRRQWMSAVPAMAGLAVLPFKKHLLASGEPLPMTAESSPMLGICQVGFRVDGKKRIILRGAGFSSNDQLQLVSTRGTCKPVALTPDSAFDFGPAAIVEFSELTAQDTYRAKFRTEESLPFPVAPDAWKRILPILAGYQYQQRCGYSFPGGRSACHRDDARRRDNAFRVDTTGGWHDAGDLRKWVDATLMNLFGLLALIRNLKTHPNSGALSLSSLRSEARYGNAFFLKMQDVDGRVWADVAGGVNGDNSDNHWTDNTEGTGDDRWVNVEKRPAIQAMFVTAQVSMAQAFSDVDASYSARCLSAGVRCWNANPHASGGNTLTLAWWVLAASELYRSTAGDTYKSELVRLTEKLRSIQILIPQNGQTFARGFFPMWPGNPQPLRDPVHSALPAYALLRASDALMHSGGADSTMAAQWKSAARTYIDEYLFPMVAKSAYGIVPFGLFWQAPADENYRPLGGGYRYRFFMPVYDRSRLWAGLNSHLLSHALLLAQAELQFGDKRYRDMAYAQLEWVFGANPFGSSLVTGLGSRQPPAFSPFVGLIAGGIMNGIAGNAEDQAVLDLQDSTDWRTNEYWSPHVGYCQWALSVLEQNS